MTTKTRQISLSKLPDKSIWISDNRIAALISGKGIKQIDYHGTQPVSRNAIMFDDEDYTIRVSLGKQGSKNRLIQIENIIWHPNKIESPFEFLGLKGKLHIGLYNSSLLIWITVEDLTKSPSAPEMQIILNSKSFTKNVKGERKHYLVSEENDTVIFRVCDKINLHEWMRNSGPYKGDFMIPESWRRLIFKNRKVSGSAVYDDLKEEYKTGNMFLYDENTFFVMGGELLASTYDNNNIIFFYDTAADEKGNFLDEPFCMTFAPDITTALKLYDEAKINYKRLIESFCGISDFRYAEEPKLLADHENIKDFFELVPKIAMSAEIDKKGIFRACPTSYYWVWAWDSMAFAGSLPYFDTENKIKDVVRFIRINRDIDGAIPMQWTRRFEPMDVKGFGALDFLFANLVMKVFSSDMDFSFLRENYPSVIHSFRKLLEVIDDRGFFCSIGFYPDLPIKLGRSEKGMVAMEIAAFYSLAIQVNRMAAMMNDKLSMSQSEKVIGLLKENFMNSFFDDEKGFLIDSIDDEGNKNLIYPLYSFLFLLESAGFSLIENELDKITKFIEKYLFDENGFRLVPKWDSKKSSEDVMNSWYPYWDLFALKILRRTKKNELIKRWLTLTDECFGKFGYCPEYVTTDFHNEKWAKHGTPWNLNCSAGWYQSIIENSIGIEEDIGGITYIPLDPGGSKTEIKKIFLKKMKCDIQVSGSGDYVSKFNVNGVDLKGCLKIPAAFNNAESLKIKIVHSKKESPLFFKEFNGAIVNAVECNHDMVTAIVTFSGFSFIRFYSKTKAKFFIDGKDYDFKYSDDLKEGTLSLFLTGSHKLSISI